MSFNWALYLPLILGAVSVMWLLPHERKQPRIVPALLGLAALLAFANQFLPPQGDYLRDGLVWLFGGVAILSGVLMITDRNPVYAALWFAVVTLATCGLFLLNSAPFLAAATIIIYAGAIVVTFVFVIMLAQPEARGTYDLHSQQRRFGTLLAFVLLGVQLFAIQEWKKVDAPRKELSAATAEVERAPAQGLTTLRALGRFLFSEQLYAVEIAGTVVLIATIGAIALAPRRPQGTL